MSNAKMAAGKRRKRAGCLRWLGRVVLGVVLLLFGLAAVGAIYQGIASARDAKLYKPTDQMVDVDGVQMRLDCRGSGSPTVVLEAGAQSHSIHWWRVQDEVAKFTRVCSYDRPGYGWSDPAPAMSSSQQVAGLLHALLEAAGEGPPYLMVGHSLGGVFVRAFAAEYPGEVIGMVLVDSSHEQQNLRIPPGLEEYSAIQIELANTNLPIFQGAATLGLLRATGFLEANVAFLGVPDDQREPVLAQFYRSGFYGAMKREVALMEICLNQPGELKSLGDMPLIVLSAGQDAREMYEDLALLEPYLDSPSQLTLEIVQSMVDRYDENQDELAALSTRGERIAVEDTGHNIHLDQPQVVVDAVREVFEQVPR